MSETENSLKNDSGLLDC